MLGLLKQSKDIGLQIVAGADNLDSYARLHQLIEVIAAKPFEEPH